jgi:NAD(P)-dependent dehydrogenase (short-subunit alcohol dehydrogenase family)
MHIIVTGASRGIGYEVVKKFAADGNHRIIALSRNGEALERLKRECYKINPDARIIPFPFDLVKGMFRDELKPLVEEYLGKVDRLVNNAGRLVLKPFESFTAEDYDLMFDVNFRSVVNLLQSVLPLFNPDSHVVNISSMGGYQGSAKFPGLSLYSASKGALAVLGEVLAEEWKDRRIFVNNLALGAVQTEMFQKAFPGIKAPLKANELADFVADFALNGHRYFNGKTLPVSSSTP